MKPIFLMCRVLVLALSGLACAPQTLPSISTTDDSLSVSVSEVDDGIMTENLSTAPCIVVVSSPEGEQRFELATGENVTVTGITEPLEATAVSG